MQIEKEAKELFGEMREVAPEETNRVNGYIKSISSETGRSFFDIPPSVEEQLKKLKEFAEKNKDREVCCTCSWYTLFEGVCVNGHSPNCADCMDMLGYCDYYERKTE